ncbi:MAG TPA: DUF4367 domain-containing protein [Verrucomicrobiae bacterium]|nr:DUF4367 domain-containing protein [Verrucomicrobiae bacterium]
MGSAKQNTIQLNGRHYDARTGKLMSAQETVTSGNKTYVKPLAQQSGVVLDGFAKRTHAKTPAKKVHQRTEKSKTLMRHAVKKPTTPKAGPERMRVKRHVTPHLDIDPGRHSRTTTISKSHMVSRFGVHAPITPTTSVLPVQPEPTAPPISPLTQHHEVFGSNLQPLSLEKAIEQATSHTQPKHKKLSKRQKVAHRLRVSSKTTNIAAASLATVLLAGFIAFQNVPNLAMRVATARAGVQGSLPAYQPAGFGMNGPIQYKPGQITISYKSNSDTRGFRVSQKTSEWNTETLREEYVASDRRAYQTFQDGERTIYIYDGSNATWVDEGVWYQIEGNSSLNSDQLLRIAASM